MTKDELIEWSRTIADACMRTAIKPEEVETACAAYMQAKEGKQTNYEKYFGTPEKAAESMSNANGFNRAFDRWANGDGALLCSITPARGSRKAKKQAEVFEIWLKEESE